MSVSVTFPNVSGHMLPPEAARSDLLYTIPIRTGLVDAWTCLCIPRLQALLSRSVLLPKAEGLLVSRELLVAFFCRNLARSRHPSLLFVLLFVFFPSQDKKKVWFSLVKFSLVKLSLV